MRRRSMTLSMRNRYRKQPATDITQCAEACAEGAERAAQKGFPVDIVAIGYTISTKLHN